MNLEGYDAWVDEDCDALIDGVEERFAPIFRDYGIVEKRAVYRYHFARRPKKSPPSLKNRLVSLYDPRADRSRRFPDGLRWCLNVYVGCAHNCSYCYVNGYSHESVGMSPRAKRDYEKRLRRDLLDLRTLGVPRVPLHLSNSTDPLQETLELKYRHTLSALQHIQRERDLFSQVVILTKNPGLLCTEVCSPLLSEGRLEPLTVQVSCAFWRDEARQFFEPQAPTVQSRLRAMEHLAARGIRVELRIDPLFPASRISETVRAHKPLPYYGLPETQTDDDLVRLVRLAHETGVAAIVAKPLKVPVSGKATRCKTWFKNLYAEAGGGRRQAHGGSWRLPHEYQHALIASLAAICVREGVPFKSCIHDVLSRR